MHTQPAVAKERTWQEKLLMPDWSWWAVLMIGLVLLIIVGTVFIAGTFTTPLGIETTQTYVLPGISANLELYQEFANYDKPGTLRGGAMGAPDAVPYTLADLVAHAGSNKVYAVVYQSGKRGETNNVYISYNFQSPQGVVERYTATLGQKPGGNIWGGYELKTTAQVHPVLKDGKIVAPFTFTMSLAIILIAYCPGILLFLYKMIEVKKKLTSKDAQRSN